MDDGFVNGLCLAGLAGIGGYLGWLLTAAEIVAVSNPVGIVCGAMTLVGIAVSAADDAKKD